MTGDLAITPRPVIVERTHGAPAVRDRAIEAHATGSPARPALEEPRAPRPKALLADGTVRVRAHRDEASARLVLQILDRTTGEMIEQYPPDQLLRLYAALRDSLGALVDERA
jgi:flagellar protein FlaG